MDDEQPRPSGQFITVQQMRFKQFEVLGEAKVRERLQSGRYYGAMAERAREWLSRFDEARAAELEAAREARMEASNRESLRIAKSAKNAAWAAAIAAVIAVIVPIVMPFILGWFGVKP